jgi:hypothetical protein
MDPYEVISEAALQCRLCDDHPRIAELRKAGKFRYCWKPWRVSLPATVGQHGYEFLFIGMEPVSADLPPDGSEPQPGGFSEPLRFSIQLFLFGHGRQPTYLITNMARCSLPVTDARETRALRYQHCAAFLTREIHAAGPMVCLVSIGKEPQWFIESYRNDWYGDVQHIHRITHYANAANSHFERFATAHAAEYEVFKHDNRELYCQFRRGEGATRTQSQFAAEHDMRRIFKWRHELRAIRDCGVCRGR